MAAAARSPGACAPALRLHRQTEASHVVCWGRGGGEAKDGGEAGEAGEGSRFGRQERRVRGVFLFVFSVVFFFLSFFVFYDFFCCCCILLYREVIAIIPLIETDRTERQNYLMNTHND